jgi:hypothetical protein
MKTDAKKRFQTWFGVLSPTGHVVMAFTTDGDAKRARQLLVDSGFSQEDITHYAKAEVMAEEANPLQIGQELDSVDNYLSLAKQGCGFLVLYAPEDDAAKRAVSIVKPLGLRLADKYNHLTMEQLW